ncbi:uncharacterized protein [Macaca nemestrina]|uniref:uncharacterized protein n=1 Tax=Macaca nemestrina TaxID=9545 RepID=UPI0039B963F0
MPFLLGLLPDVDAVCMHQGPKGLEKLQQTFVKNGKTDFILSSYCSTERDFSTKLDSKYSRGTRGRTATRQGGINDEHQVGWTTFVQLVTVRKLETGRLLQNDRHRLTLDFVDPEISLNTLHFHWASYKHLLNMSQTLSLPSRPNLQGIKDVIKEGENNCRTQCRGLRARKQDVPDKSCSCKQSRTFLLCKQEEQKSAANSRLWELVNV